MNLLDSYRTRVSQASSRNWKQSGGSTGVAAGGGEGPFSLLHAKLLFVVCAHDKELFDGITECLAVQKDQDTADYDVDLLARSGHTPPPALLCIDCLYPTEAIAAQLICIVAPHSRSPPLSLSLSNRHVPMTNSGVPQPAGAAVQHSQLAFFEADNNPAAPPGACMDANTLVANRIVESLPPMRRLDATLEHYRSARLKADQALRNLPEVLRAHCDGGLHPTARA
jgi:hypothetical protein